MNLFYREIAPSTNIAPLVLSFWEFSVIAGDFAPIQHEIFPDGCISLFYHRNDNLKIHRLFFSGLNLESITVYVSPGDTFRGMRISPAACANILQIDPIIFKSERMLEAEKFPHLTDGLLEKLELCESFTETAEVFENRIKELSFRENIFDKKIHEALEIIEETTGEIKISALAERLNLSKRQLERRFKASSGLSPKQFARTRRFRATAVDLVENNNLNWANRAAEMGFSDQAHLTKEFVSVTKRSPNSFAKKVSQIKHGNLVK